MRPIANITTSMAAAIKTNAPVTPTEAARINSHKRPTTASENVVQPQTRIRCFRL
jgi:hypothetical protein